MATFLSLLRSSQPTPTAQPRRWIFVLCDQLSDQIGPLAHRDPSTVGIVLVENRQKARRRPYHQQKLALILANQRHFALEQARRGVAVRYVFGDAPYAQLLAPVIAEVGTLTVMRPAEREARSDLAPLIADGRMEEIPHEGWLTSVDDFLQGAGRKTPWRMDRFYQHVRRRSGILMTAEGKPVGGRYSFDGDNRRAWRGEPKAPTPPQFDTTDPVKQEVAALIATHYADHPGTVSLANLPATAEDARRLWAWALAECMTHFGPYEDAMSRNSRGLFHTRISSLLNIHRLLPAAVVQDVASLDVPINSKEGFIRQVLGWREFVHHVHEQTDGFRNLDGVTSAQTPGDGGFSQWSGQPWPGRAGDGGACPNHLNATNPLPAAWWGKPSGLACLDHVVAALWDDGWTHHIPRLMILSNIAMLLDVSPRELADWFWVAYTDAYDWVVEPNVLSMGTFSTGPLMTTKPYAAGGAYINRMSDHCKDCAFNPRKNCPITSLYWQFLARNESKLEGIFRMKPLLRNLQRRSAEQHAADAKTTEALQAALRQGIPFAPDTADADPQTGLPL